MRSPAVFQAFLPSQILREIASTKHLEGLRPKLENNG
jgi:hypothetical protein